MCGRCLRPTPIGLQCGDCAPVVAKATAGPSEPRPAPRPGDASPVDIRQVVIVLAWIGLLLLAVATLIAPFDETTPAQHLLGLVGIVAGGLALRLIGQRIGPSRR